MSRTLISMAAVSLGLLASGCATPAGRQLSASNNPSVYSVHQPIVQRTDFVFDVATTSDGVSPAELARLDGWFNSIQLRYGDQLSIDWPGGYENPDVARDISAVAGRHGLLFSNQAAPLTAGPVQSGTVRVVTSRSTASVPGCPSWDSTNLDPVNGTSSNYGCATNSNLAAMIANPDDLIVGQDGSVNGTGMTASRAIRTYRERAPTGSQGLQQTSTTSGN